MMFRLCYFCVLFIIINSYAKARVLLHGDLQEHQSSPLPTAHTSTVSTNDEFATPSNGLIIDPPEHDASSEKLEPEPMSTLDPGRNFGELGQLSKETNRLSGQENENIGFPGLSGIGLPQQKTEVDVDGKIWLCGPRFGPVCKDNEHLIPVPLDNNRTWDACCIEKECYWVRASNYRGTWSTSLSGYQCQTWLLQVPHRHNFSDSDFFPDDSLPEAANFCRDPNNSGKVWCVTMDLHVVVEECPIHKCPGSSTLCVTWSIFPTIMVGVVVIQRVF